MDVDRKGHELARRALMRGLTILLAVSAPSLYWMLEHEHHDWSQSRVITVTFVAIVITRAAFDLALRRFLPKTTVSWELGDESARLAARTERRRYWFWRYWFRVLAWYSLICEWISYKHHHPFLHEFTTVAPGILGAVAHPAALLQAVQVVGLFAVNFLIFMGPMLAMNISQIKGFEPGDVNLGVEFDDVRGQAEAKEEIRRVIAVWEDSDRFRELGGKPDRGMLFLGAPGVGKTMIAKAVATSFNAPFVFIPGSGFAATFIGIDAIVVRYMYRKAKKLARKWGGQCIVFIDEIDAVARSRSNTIGGQVMGMGGMMGGGMGQMALNQLLVVMDSIESPPWLRRTFVSRFNLLLDALFFIPQKLGPVKLRLPIPKPRKDEQVYFLGATNVALEALDSALVRAGRMGRHIYFRNPTKNDRKDILDLYVAKVSHEPDLDTELRRDELARITEGVSPASIEQICSMALINAQNNGRSQFGFRDFLEAMTTLQAGTAVGIEYTEDETMAVALHEAGHAAASHIYCPHIESSRLSIRMRGSSLGHHMALEKEERFGRWRAEDFGEMVRGVAAMATEYVFYSENGRGVSGDLAQCSALARLMVNHVGMIPYFTEIPDPEITKTPGQEPKAVVRSPEEKVRQKFAFIGRRLLTPAPDGQYDKSKEQYAAEFLGHAFVTAWNFIEINQDKIQRIADVLTEQREIFGNDVLQLLDDQELESFDHLELKNFLDFNAWPYL